MWQLGTVQAWVFLLFFGVIFVLSVWALVDCLSRPASAFVAAGKRTRTFWALVTGAAVVCAFLGLPLTGLSMQFLGIVAAVAAVLYLVDVRPAVAPYSRRGGRGGRGGSGGPRSSGGW